MLKFFALAVTGAYVKAAEGLPVLLNRRSRNGEDKAFLGVTAESTEQAETELWRLCAAEKDGAEFFTSLETGIGQHGYPTAKLHALKCGTVSEFATRCVSIVTR